MRSSPFVCSSHPAGQPRLPVHISMDAVTTPAAGTDTRRPPTTGGPGATRRTGPPFSVVVGRFRDTVVATLHGPLDLAASVAVAGVLRTLMEGQGRLDVVLDLGDVGRIDGSGLHVLASAARSLAARGGELSLARPGGVVAGSLAAADLGRLISAPTEPPPVARSADEELRASLASHPPAPAGSTPTHEETRHDSL